MRVYEAIADSLSASGVDTVSGLVGEGNIALATRLHREHGVRYLAARREDAAVAIADGYARASGRLGVATVTHGPGLTNTVTALVEAARARTPLVLLAGAVGLGDRVNRQQMDQRRLAEATGASVVDVATPTHAVADVLSAMTQAVTTSGPVVVNLFTDVLQTEVGDLAVKPWQPPIRQRVSPDPDAVATVAQALGSVQRPVILAGRGAVLSDARAEIERLAEKIGAVVCTSLFAKGFFAGNPYDVGVCGGFASGLAERLIRDSDCVVAFGASLNRWTSAKGEMFTGTVVQCDTDERAIGRWLTPHHAIVGDAAATAAALTSVVGSAAGYRTPALATEIARYDVSAEFVDKSSPDGLDVHSVSVALDRLLPDNRQIVVDVGHFMSVPSRYVRVPDGRGYQSPSSFGAVGLSLPAAIGAAAARTDRPTVCFVGDGGALMSLGEIETVQRLGLPILIVLMNDNAYGAELHLCAHHAVPPDLAWFGPVDFAAAAQGLGLPARQVSTLDDLGPAVRALGSGPGLLDVRLDATIATAYYRQFAGPPLVDGVAHG
jgi:thiamine pyrophosphate-dependent acetolactate synthase large subunit-like protein